MQYLEQLMTYLPQFLISLLVIAAAVIMIWLRRGTRFATVDAGASAGMAGWKSEIAIAPASTTAVSPAASTLGPRDTSGRPSTFVKKSVATSRSATSNSTPTTVARGGTCFLIRNL